jgi:hypothetical protein
MAVGGDGVSRTIETGDISLPGSKAGTTEPGESTGTWTGLGVFGRPVLARDVLSLVHGGYAVLLDLRTERYLVLDEVGAYVWALIVQAGDDGLSLPAAVESLAGEFDAPQAVLERDIGALIDQLRRLGVVQGVARSCVESGRKPPSALQCALSLTGAVIALRVLGLRRSTAIARRLAGGVPTVVVPTLEFLASVVDRMNTAAAFFPGRALCLEQSLALFVVLRRAGVGVRLRIGAQPFPFAAHAWVEYEGKPVGEGDDRVGKFVPFEGLGV